MICMSLTWGKYLQTTKYAAPHGITPEQNKGLSMSTAALTAEMKKFQASLRPHKRAILEGTMLAIDPASISLGWAWFEAGQLIISGEYKAPRTHPPHKRLSHLMEQLVQWTKPDLMVVEKLFKYNASLVWSVGATIVTVMPEAMIECPIRVWRALAADDYEKSDQADAEMIGKAVIHFARGLK